MSRVLVVDAQRRPLHPCTPARARLLLQQRKAAVLRHFPFVLTLQKTKPETLRQELRAKIDPGSKTTGLARCCGQQNSSTGAKRCGKRSPNGGEHASHVALDRPDTASPGSTVEEDDEDTQKTGAIKVSRKESTQQEALSTAAPDDFHHQSGVQSSRLLGVVVLVTRILMVVIIGLFFLVFPRVVLPKSNTHATPQLSAGVAATATVAVATSTPSPIPGLTITPDNFNATIGCTFAQGRYKCTITLALSKDHQNKLKWSVSRSGLTATFSPSKGRLGPGHQQQIVLYVYNNCPHSGFLIVSVGGKTIPIPWSC